LATNPASLDQFNRASTWTGPKQQHALLQQSFMEEEEPAYDPEPVKKLRLQIKQEVTEMVKFQKFHGLLKGNWFKASKPKSKQLPYVHMRLSESRQEIIYGSCPSMDVLPIDSELITVKVSDLGDPTMGITSPSLSKKKTSSTPPQDDDLFSLSLTVRDSKLDLTATNKEDVANWTEGIRMLTSDSKMDNIEMLENLNQLTSLEMRVRLLELEGIDIPEQPPVVPPTPDNYNFATN